MSYRLHHGDCRSVLAEFDADSFDSCVTDAPYEIGFMSKTWDKRGVAFDPETWRAVLRVLKPGAFLLTFGGTRTHHRMTCAIEDAGFEIRDTLLWLYGTGYPKNKNISKEIDARAGAERPVVENRGTKPTSLGAKGHASRVADVVTAPVTPEAIEWSGWGTALKPAWEPIVVARKPLTEGNNVVAQVLATGTGAMNIDACRVPLVGEKAPTGSGKGSKRSKFGQVASSKGNGGNVTPPAGRYPPNVLLDPVAAEILDEQTGELESGYMKPRTPRRSDVTRNAFGVFKGNATVGGTYGDRGGASRFFYCPKVSPEERDGSEHPTMKPIAVMRWLVQLVTRRGGRVLEPFLGSGTTGIACLEGGWSFDGIEQDPDYFNISRRRIGQVLPFRTEAP